MLDISRPPILTWMLLPDMILLLLLCKGRLSFMPNRLCDFPNKKIFLRNYFNGTSYETHNHQQERSRRKRYPSDHRTGEKQATPIHGSPQWQGEHPPNKAEHDMPVTNNKYFVDPSEAPPKREEWPRHQTPKLYERETRALDQMHENQFAGVREWWAPT